MLKLIKYLKSSVASILIIVVLLVGQAACDLTLPQYTSNIVNVGIQQGGVENAAPTVIRVSEMNKLFLFMSRRSRIRCCSPTRSWISRHDGGRCRQGVKSIRSSPRSRCMSARPRMTKP